MAKIRPTFYELPEAQVLSNDFPKGAIICCKDSKNIYLSPVDDSENRGNVIKIGETIEYTTEDNRAAIVPVNGKQYFCYDTGKIWIFYDRWFCLTRSGEEFNIENVILPVTGSVTISDSRIRDDSVAYYYIDGSVADLVNSVIVNCENGKCTITGVCSYPIFGTLKVMNIG